MDVSKKTITAVPGSLVVDTKADWMATTKPISKGVIAKESDTGYMKLGDGVNTYANLPYWIENSFATLGDRANIFGSASGGNKQASWTFDELVLKTALGGQQLIAVSQNLSFDGTTVGAGGMDTGSTPVNADLAIYVISGTNVPPKLLGSASVGRVYGGSHWPVGYSYSTLLWSGKTDALGNLPAFEQHDTRILVAPIEVLADTTSSGATWTGINLSTYVPANVRAVSGYLASTSSVEQPAFSGNASGVGVTPTATAGGVFTDVLLDGQELYYQQLSAGYTVWLTNYLI